MAELPERTDDQVGLDGLAKRLRKYYEQGARFAKWRAVIDIADGHPDLDLHQARTRTRSRATPASASKRRSCRSSSPKC
jgi:fructose-bisphosphate aldolase class I